MILNRRKYRFNTETLCYEYHKSTFRDRLISLLRFGFFSSVLALIFSVLIISLHGSPIETFLQHKFQLNSENLLALNKEIDSLQNVLHTQHYRNDAFYRQLLELNPIPVEIRIAGTGGSVDPDALTFYPNRNQIAQITTNAKTLKNKVNIQRSSYENILEEASTLNNKHKYVPAIQPVKPAEFVRISSFYGYRGDPFTGLSHSHNGVDFVGMQGTEIYATADGEVEITEFSLAGFGKLIVISHNFGYKTLYAHLSEILVEQGQQIKRGQVIGKMGNTGRSTGTHLHYEVHLHGEAINPINFFADDLTPTDYNLIIELASSDR